MNCKRTIFLDDVYERWVYYVMKKPIGRSHLNFGEFFDIYKDCGYSIL